MLLCQLRKSVSKDVAFTAGHRGLRRLYCIMNHDVIKNCTNILSLFPQKTVEYLVPMNKHVYNVSKLVFSGFKCTSARQKIYRQPSSSCDQDASTVPKARRQRAQTPVKRVSNAIPSRVKCQLELGGCKLHRFFRSLFIYNCYRNWCK